MVFMLCHHLPYFGGHQTCSPKLMFCDTIYLYFGGLLHFGGGGNCLSSFLYYYLGFSCL